jgi:ABC-type sugar transport system ATPase subunit
VTASPEAAQAAGVRIASVWKRYGDTVALAGLDLDAHPGRVTGVAGPNGAGKSTMVRVLGGEAVPDAGSITVDGLPWTPSIGASDVAVVHQEPQLFPNLTVSENLMVGREPGRFARPRPDARDLALLDVLGIRRYADRRLGGTPLAVRQRVEIARALARNARVVVFDEPNSALTEEESADLFHQMRNLAARGHVVILVSHRLSELVAAADSVTVLLDGRAVATLTGASLTEESIAREMVVGGRGDDGAGATAAVARRTAIEVRGWTHPKGRFRDVDFAARTGEIVAIMGVEGSGGRELTRSLAGLEPAGGQVDLGGSGSSAGARANLGAATAFVQSDRRAGLFFNLTVAENIVARLDREIAPRVGILSPGAIRSVAASWIDRMRVKTPRQTAAIGSLSGGNQQKAAIAAAMARRPPVLVLEEPTRGVDVRSKADIYRFLRDYAADGHAVVLYCTEVPEAFQAADRVVVLARGRVSEPLTVSDFGDEKALAAAIARLEASAATGAIASAG